MKFNHISLILVALCVLYTSAQRVGDKELGRGERGNKLGSMPRKNSPVLDNSIQKEVVPGQDNLRVEKKQRKEPKGLMASAECAEDAERICGAKKMQSNLELLSCLTNSQASDVDLAPECHHYLWQYKLNITMDQKFDSVARDICREPIDKFADCQAFSTTSGKLIPCLIEHKDEIQKRPCYHFLVKMSSIIFSDYRLICDFVEDCGDDINKHKCGKVDSTTKQTDADAEHSQGAVIACLEDKIVSGLQVEEKCAKQIVRMAELSSDDFHLDRNLYFNCKDDRERFCEDVSSGEGQVYKCLFRHKFDPMMSPECRSALTLRQQLVSEDYKASYEIHAACQKDIDQNNCLANPKYMVSGGLNDHNDYTGLSGILLCLEDAKMDGGKIDEHCDNQLYDFRRMLTEDYQLSPEIVKSCASEITTSCNGGIRKQGETIHCLMGLAQKNTMGKRCEEAIMHVLKESEAASDYRMDHALATACNPVIATACQDFREGDPMVLSCLMEHLYSDKMKAECRKRLLELQFFIGRDFFLDPVFTKKCNKDSKRLCDAKLSTNDNMMPYSLVVSCLYRHRPGHNQEDTEVNQDTATSDECMEEVYKVMANRALDVNLNPDLEQACLHALGKHCSEDIVKEGSELTCLQDSFEKIKEDNDEECIAALEEVTEIEEEDAGMLDKLLMRACQPEVHRLCEDALTQGDEGLVMQCLIQNKLDLNEACEAGVTHFQLIELKDVKFNYRFMKACKGDIDTQCHELKGNVHTKLDVIACLSQKVRDAKLQDVQQVISEECQAQLTVENLQAHQDYRMDPELTEFCESDYKRLCSKTKPGHAKGIECLRNHKDKLSKDCRGKLFGFEQEEAEDRELDYALMRTCKGSIKRLCQMQLKSGDQDELLDCLIHHKKSLEKGCREIILERQQEIYSDINLHPDLKQACLADIADKCVKELEMQEEDERNGGALQGRVIGCLKARETSSKRGDALTPDCSRHMKFILQEEQNEYSLDPMLTLKCVEAINLNCDAAHGHVVECLKQKYFEGKLKNHQECAVEVARLLREGRFDIMADPILHNSCIDDIRVHCHDIAEGQGRIMTCLLSVSHDSHKTMTQNCRDALVQRQKMWSYAAEHGVKSFSDIGSLIANSEHQSYLLTVLSLFLFSVLIIGVLCGRVTKRVTRQRKML